MSVVSGERRVFTLAAVYLTNSAGQVLLVRKRGTHAFMQPGGKIEPGESALEAIVRELEEELRLRVPAADFGYLGRFQAPAANESGWSVDCEVFTLTTDAVVETAAEIEELRWFDPADTAGALIAPLAETIVIPAIRARGARATTFHSSATAALSAESLYRILWLRSAVFVVEQEAAYDDIDGRDLEPGTVQFWAEEGGEAVATLRLLDEGGSARIGRVATAAGARGRGLSAVLMAMALAQCGDRRVDIDAQKYLEAWYGRFGFVTSGPEFLEDGIPHLPMTRTGR